MLLIVGLAMIASHLISAQMQSPLHCESHSPLGIPLVGPPLPLDMEIKQSYKIPFVPHTDDLIWLGQELNYTYVKPIFDKLSESHDSLQSRGEAHITVISPPEFSVLAAANVTIDDINKIAVDYEIQASNFEVICLGRAKVEDNTVYQIIVYSDDLVRIRTRIFQLYWNNGGNPALFDPKSFWPHITVGYTSQDLFLEDGVYKGVNLCWRSLKLINSSTDTEHQKHNMQSLSESKLLSKVAPKQTTVPKLAKTVVKNAAKSSTTGSGNAVAGKAKPLRSTKTSQKLVFFPSETAESTSSYVQQDETDHEGDMTPVVHLPLERHVLGSRTVAERMTKDQRDRFSLPRVSAYCLADRFNFEEARKFLKEQHHVTPRVYDECLYAPYHFPIMTLRPGGKNSTNVRLRSAPWPEAEGRRTQQEDFYHQYENDQMTYEEENLYADALENVPAEPVEAVVESSTAQETSGFYEVGHTTLDPVNEESGYIASGDITEPEASFSPETTNYEHPPQEVATDFEAILASEQLDPEMIKTDDKVRAEERRDSEHSTKAAHTKPFTGGELFIFDYGVLVFWNFSRAQELLMLEDLSDFAIRPLKDNPDDLEDMQIEEMHFQYDTTQKHSRIFNDMLTLKSGNHMIKLTLSHGISQSAVLARYEDIMDNTIEATKHIPKKLALTGKLDMKRKEMTQINGHLFKLRMNVNLSSNVLDTPEIFWSEPSLQPLYNAIRDYLEIPQRAAILNDRCTVVSDLLSMLREHMNNFGVEYQTLIIIYLIIVAVLVACIEIAVKILNQTAETPRSFRT